MKKKTAWIKTNRARLSPGVHAALDWRDSLTNRHLNLTPPPPVHSLHPFLTTVAGAGSVASLDREDIPQPFPRSLSSYVFSLPTIIACNSVHYGSAAYLRPTAFETSSSGHGGIVKPGSRGRQGQFREILRQPPRQSTKIARGGG